MTFVLDPSPPKKMSFFPLHSKFYPPFWTMSLILQFFFKSFIMSFPEAPYVRIKNKKKIDHQLPFDFVSSYYSASEGAISTN